MHTLHSRSRYIFCTSLIVTLLLGNEFVYGRLELKKRQSPSYSNTNWKYYDSDPYASRQSNNQSGSGNRLYPTLDFTNPGQIDPGFSPHYHMRLNGTYVPNVNWGNGNVNHNNRYPPVNPNNRYPPVNRYPNGNYSNFNVHNPQNNQLPVDLVSQSNLPLSRTNCGKTLCSYVANYPTKEIGNAVERAREVLRSGNANSLRNKGLSLETFTSRRYIHPHRVSPGSSGPNLSSSCRANTNTIYPHEGFSSDNNQAYYIVNVPSLAQPIGSVECDSKNSQTCGQGVGRPTSGIKTCQQTYKKRPLLAVPFGKNYIDVNDFQLRTFYIPTDCICL